MTPSLLSALHTLRGCSSQLLGCFSGHPHSVGSDVCIQMSLLLGHSSAIQYRITVPIPHFTDLSIGSSLCLYRNWIMSYLYFYFHFQVSSVLEMVQDLHCNTACLYWFLPCLSSVSLTGLSAFWQWKFILSACCHQDCQTEDLLYKWLEQLTNAPLLSCELLPCCEGLLKMRPVRA